MGYFRSKARKVSITIELCILELVYVPNFSLTFLFWTKFAPKKVFSVENGKSEHRHWILQNQISIGTKFQLILTILFFWTKFTRKGYFWSKMWKVNKFACIHGRLLLYYIFFFVVADRHNGTCSKKRQRRTKRLLKRVKPRKVRVNDGQGAQAQGCASRAI